MTASPASPQSGKDQGAPVQRKVRSRLFLKYAGLFVAVVCVALVTNGLFEIWVSYREHKDALIPDPARTGGVGSEPRSASSSRKSKVRWAGRRSCSGQLGPSNSADSMRCACCARFPQSPSLPKSMRAARSNCVCRDWPWMSSVAA